MNEQALRGAATGQSPAEQARGKDARVVDDEQVAALKERRQLDKMMVGERAGPAVEDEQPGLPSVRRRLLRDQVRREVEIEVSKVQTS